MATKILIGLVICVFIVGGFMALRPGRRGSGGATGGSGGNSGSGGTDNIEI